MPSSVLTTYQVAKICHSHHTTVINWVKQGKLKAYQTPGGHRRIRGQDLAQFMERYDMPVPEELQKRQKMVLVVDDDLEMLDEYKTALSGNGFDLEFAADGFEAARKIYQRKPDLILLDFKMPGMDGYDVCKRLQQDEEFCSIPVFAVTVLNSQEDIQKIKKAGVREYVPKPVDIARLIKLIERTLEITISI